jgi:CRISPR-associated protein Cmr6
MNARRANLPALERMPPTANPGLWYSRYLAQVEEKAAGDGPSTKDVHLLQVQSYVSTGDDSYGRCYTQWVANLKSIPLADVRTATTVERCLVGLGGESVLETSISLHHTYGVPFIPGSALKGLTAAYAQQYGGTEWSATSGAFQTVFGNQESAGVIDFLDAYWEPVAGQKPFAQDIMSVHQFQYYSEDQHAPSDREKLNIVSFLSVAKGLNFIIPLVGPAAWRDATYELLTLALRHLGIGAKTNAGYGRLAMTQKIDPDALAAAPLLTQIDAVAAAQAKSMLGQIAGRMTKDIREKKLTPRAARMVAEAIVAKAEAYKLEKSSLWYIDLIKFLQTPS